MGIMALKNTAQSVAVFSAQLANFSDYVKEEVSGVSDDIGLFIWTMVVDFTPRLSGRAQASWNFSYNVPNYAVPSVGSYSKPTPPSLRGKNEEFIAVFVSSGLDYMQALEDGWSSKGERMMEKTLNAVDFAIPTIIGGRKNV